MRINLVATRFLWNSRFFFSIPTPNNSSNSSNNASAALDDPPPPLKTGKPFVDKINHAFFVYPVESMFAMSLIDGGIFVGSLGALNVIRPTIPAEFAMAYALTRPLRRLRIPVELGLAMGISKVVPSLAQVQVSLLGRAIRMEGKLGEWQRAIESHKVVRAVGNTIDKLGFAYFISSRAIGVSLIIGVYFAIKQGIDFEAMLINYGLTGIQTAAHVAGYFAVASVCTSSLYPVTVSLYPKLLDILIPKLTPYVQMMNSTMEELQNNNNNTDNTNNNNNKNNNINSKNDTNSKNDSSSSSSTK